MQRNPDAVEHLKRIQKTGGEATGKKYQEDPEHRVKILANLAKAWEVQRKHRGEVSP